MLYYYVVAHSYVFFSDLILCEYFFVEIMTGIFPLLIFSRKYYEILVLLYLEYNKSVSVKPFREGDRIFTVLVTQSKKRFQHKYLLSITNSVKSICLGCSLYLRINKTVNLFSNVSWKK